MSGDDDRAVAAFHLLNTGTEGFTGMPADIAANLELAAMYVATPLFTANGAGRFSVDEQVLGGELKLYKASSTR